MDTVGKLYSNGCIHCRDMETAWDDMKKQVEDKVEVKDFEASNIDTELAEFNKERGTDVAVQGGYPTIYKIKGGVVSYYNGGRSTKELVQWALGTKTGGACGKKSKKSKKNKSKKNKSRRRR